MQWVAKWGLGGLFHEPHTKKLCPPKGYGWVGKGSSEEFIKVTWNPECPALAAASGLQAADTADVGVLLSNRQEAHGP